VSRRRRSIFDIIEEYMERMEETIERYLEGFEERRLWHPSSETIEPLANVYVEPREVVITVDIPCADRDGINVRFIDENTVEIEARLQRTLDFQSFKIMHRSGRFTKHYVRVDLPVPVEPNRAVITCYRNILEVRIPRRGFV